MNSLHPELRKWYILLATSLGVFMATLDASIVNIALPQITAYYNAPLSSVEWVVMVYLLLISSLLLTYGRMGDMYGNKPVYIWGFVIFTISSALNSLAPNISFLIASRALQALGAGMIMAVVQAIIADTFNSSERGRAIGINAMFVSLGLAIGPTIGGLLVSFFGWQSIFIINIPIGIMGTIWAWWVLPQKEGTKQKFDVIGAITIFTCLMTFLLAMSHGETWGWQSPRILILFIIAFCFFVLFLYTEKRVTYPMIRLGLFKNRLFTAANFAAFLNYLTQYAVTFLMPFYLQNILLMTARKAGLVMSAFPLVMMLTAPVSGILSDRLGSRVLTSLGMGINALAIMILTTLNGTDSIPIVISGLALIGLGTGLFLSPNNNAIMGSVPKNQIGVGSGMLATMRNLGQVMGIAITGAVFSNRLSFHTFHLQSQGIDSKLIATRSFTLALHDAYFVAMSVAIIGVLVCLMRGASESISERG
jgi:EmrB/QacA subfamily drug resistance transporter